MKAALIDQTGLKELPLAASLHRRGHHLVIVSSRQNPPIAPGSIATRCEHHHIGLDDVSQLVTALQGCSIAVVCTGDLPTAHPAAAFDPAGERTLREACRRAGVPQLTHLRFTHTRTNSAPLVTRSADAESSHAA